MRRVKRKPEGSALTKETPFGMAVVVCDRPVAELPPASPGEEQPPEIYALAAMLGAEDAKLEAAGRAGEEDIFLRDDDRI